MRKTLIIMIAIALLGIGAAYVNPLGKEDDANQRATSGGGVTSSSSGTTAATSSSVQSSSSASTQMAAYKDGTYQGGTYSSRYGDVRLSVVIQNGKIVDVATDVLTEFDPQSQEIDNEAVPRLKSQALAVQSANIDSVSGASFTSASYQRSLQSALDKAKA